MNIVVIGCGNLAHSLVPVLAKHHTIRRICGRTSGSDLAKKVKAEFIRSIKEIDIRADIYFIAVSDHAIREVVLQLPKLDGVILHCSGATAMEVLNYESFNYGVFYPLQTFSKTKILEDFSLIPIFVEASNRFTQKIICELANELSSKVYYLDSIQRCSLHLAAVFSCNFTNYLLTLSFKLLKEQDISIDFIRPLMEKTISQAFDSGDPRSLQTGPAIRDDKLTVEKHLELIKNKPDTEKVYKILTQLIKEYRNE